MRDRAMSRLLISRNDELASIARTRMPEVFTRAASYFLIIKTQLDRAILSESEIRTFGVLVAHLNLAAGQRDTTEVGRVCSSLADFLCAIAEDRAAAPVEEYLIEALRKVGDRAETETRTHVA